jgi:hypothetical protein
MMLHKLRIALAVTVLALAAVAAADSASALGYKNIYYSGFYDWP